MQRRQFIQSSCNLCLLAASGYFYSALSGCSPAFQVIKTEVVNDAIQIPLASLSQSNFQIVRPQGWYYDIALEKKNDGSYETLLLQCTHQQNQLVPTNKGYLCNLHGSQFDKEGNVTKGPAENSLKKYNTTIEQDKLIIHLKG
jgi:Rieske Fe-S protein